MKVALIPVPDLKVGDFLASYDGAIIAIRDTAMRRYFTVQRADGTTCTDYQAKASNIAVRISEN